MKLLYAEDERAMSEAVTDILEYHKYTVDAVYDGESAWEYARQEHYDGIILDVMMPNMSGLEVVRRLRADGCRTPILLLTAKGEVEHRIEGLDVGADDYLTKPFAMGELLARVRAMLRRTEQYTPDVLTCGDVTLDRRSYELCCGAERMLLPKQGYRMMELLMRHRGMYLSTEDILIKVWGYQTDADIGIVWVYISHLRKRLLTMGAHVEIRVKRNIGYMLEVMS